MTRRWAAQRARPRESPAASSDGEMEVPPATTGRSDSGDMLEAAHSPLARNTWSTMCCAPMLGPRSEASLKLKGRMSSQVSLSA